MKRISVTQFSKITVFLLTMFFMVCSHANAVKPAHDPIRGGEYRVPLASEPNTLDPAKITTIYAVNVALNLFDGLVQFDENLNVVPAIAKRWIISRDHQKYTFYLHKGIRFHNGREVNAQDFIFSFERILNPKTQSPAASLFAYVKGAKEFIDGKTQTVSGFTASNPHVLNIELEKSFAPFLSILATANAKVVPREAVGPGFGKQPVGTGAFRFRTWDQGHSIVLAANNDYFSGRPHIDVLRFRIYTNIEWEKIFNDFEKGLLDQAIIPKSRYDEIVSNPVYTQNYKLVSTPGLNLVYIGMNQNIPPFDDPRIRQAIYHAVDTENIVKEITKRGSVPAKGILPPGIAGYRPDDKMYAYDPQKARQLLKEAGFPEGRGMSPIEIWTVSKSDSVKKELLAYQKYLADVGIRLTPRVAKNWKEFVKLIKDKKAPMFYAAWYADYPDPDNFLYVLAHSQSPTNRMAYKNFEIDKMLEKARHETDYMKRVDLYQKIEQVVMKEAPVICQHVNSFNCLLQPWVKGVDVGYLGPAYIPFRQAQIDRGALARLLSAQGR
jgi:peptide/nickel transport system substrate-binding protein/oligopeptide transport system substrate-binding protein